MSCGGGKANFRLLDAYVGWDATDPAHSNLTGFDDPAGISLALVNPGAVDPSQILAYLPPARLARGCGACEWYLITPVPPASRLLRRDACHPEWGPIWNGSCRPESFVDAVAVAAWRRWIAVSDHGANEVRIWAGSGATPLAEIPIDQPGPLAFTPRGELLITSASSSQVSRYGPDGIARGMLKAPLPDRVNRIAVDHQDRVWIVTGDQEASWQLWRAGHEDDEFKQATVGDLAIAFPPTGIVAASAAGFCFEETGSDGLAVTSCFSWYGRPLAAGVVSPPSVPQVQTQGQLLTDPIDSGIPRCRWHRVRIDADVPAGTTLSVAVATMEDLSTVSQGDSSRDPNWSAFPAGSPHFSDWTSPAPGSLDFLIDQPPGRYLFFRLRFTGNGSATPVVRRVRIDFPRVTSLEHLPVVYRETPKAEDFTERFLSLFDASIRDLDSIIERYPALLDPSGVPEQMLPWLGSFFDIGFDATWNADKRRQILHDAPKLYRQRGTLAGMQTAIELVFGVTPAIDEASATGMWGALGTKRALKAARCSTSTPPPSLRRSARLGSVRLFGKTRSRFRLDHSPLAGAPLRSYGNPDQDPFVAGSYRFQVLVPPIAKMTKEDRDRLTSLIESQKPAHTVASVRVGGAGFLLGSWSAVEVDTSLTPLAAPILGRDGNVRLNRMSVLWNGPKGPENSTVLGQNFIVGMKAIAG
jgi:phage tail-like protein